MCMEATWAAVLLRRSPRAEPVAVPPADVGFSSWSGSVLPGLGGRLSRMPSDNA